MHMASMRASETFELTMHRQEHNQTHMASMRASETFQQILYREQDRVHEEPLKESLIT